jgi:hypothetical protein
MVSNASDDFPTRQTRDHHQLVARDLDVDVLEVVLARTLHHDLVHGTGDWLGLRPI